MLLQYLSAPLQAIIDHLSWYYVKGDGDDNAVQGKEKCLFRRSEFKPILTLTSIISAFEKTKKDWGRATTRKSRRNDLSQTSKTEQDFEIWKF